MKTLRTEDILLIVAECIAVLAIACRFIPMPFDYAIAVSRDHHVGIGSRLLIPALLLVISAGFGVAALWAGVARLLPR